MDEAPILLASGSPQRTAILTQLGFTHRVVVPDVDELMHGDPEELVLENSQRKAAAVAGDRLSGELLVAVDTVVVLDGRVYGKPADEVEARAMLGILRGRTHEVLGGLTVVGDGGAWHRIARTDVTFRRFSTGAVATYLGGGEWRGRAGGYAIQGTGARLVESVRGDYLNVVGFPAAEFLEILDEMAGSEVSE